MGVREGIYSKAAGFGIKFICSNSDSYQLRELLWILSLESVFLFIVKLGNAYFL